MSKEGTMPEMSHCFCGSWYCRTINTVAVVNFLFICLILLTLPLLCQYQRGLKPMSLTILKPDEFDSNARAHTQNNICTQLYCCVFVAYQSV